MSVLVTGGAGYIGSHTCLELLQSGYEVIVVDDLVNSSQEALRRVEKLSNKKIKFYNVDLCNLQETRRIFKENPSIDVVIHFAALKAVGESVHKPLDYYANNLINTLSILQAMHEYNVYNFVFSSSATVYGEPKKVPVTEDMETSATSPYGATKLFIERILADCQKAYPKLNIANLRYFNPIGAHPSGIIGEDPNGIPNNLVPYISQVAVGKLAKITVFGNDYPTPDGTCVRDYIHVVDLAKGHVLAVEKLKKQEGLFVCNLGTGTGYSVLEVIQAYIKACKQNIPYEIGPRRAGDVPTLYADPSYAQKELGWKAEYGIEQMCLDSWNWQQKNPDGYKI